MTPGGIVDRFLIRPGYRDQYSYTFALKIQREIVQVEFFSPKQYRLSGFLLILLLIASGILLSTKGTKPMEYSGGTIPDPDLKAAERVPQLAPVRDFIEFMDREFDSSRTVGAAYTIVHEGEIIYTGTYGVRKIGTSQQINERTLFRLASVSKGFTGALACMLEQEGYLQLNDLVLDHYPGFRLKDSVNTEKLTIRHLLSHTSGLVPYAFDNLVEADADLSTIVGRLHEVDISAPPGELYGYQNVLFSMLDPILRRATGVPYPVLLEEMIFRPLGMEDASAGPVDPERVSNMAYPHVRVREDYVPLKQHDGYYNVMPAAGINASISDMGKWLLALTGKMPEVLADTIRHLLTTPVVYTPLKARYTRYWQPFRERFYSLGWRVYHYRGRTIVYHGGYIRGYRAEIGFCPEEMTGIAFLQNSPNGLASRCVPGYFDLFIDHMEAEKELKEVFESVPGRVSVAE